VADCLDNRARKIWRDIYPCPFVRFTWSQQKTSLHRSVYDWLDLRNVEEWSKLLRREFRHIHRFSDDEFRPQTFLLWADNDARWNRFSISTPGCTPFGVAALETEQTTKEQAA